MGIEGKSMNEVSTDQIKVQVDELFTRAKEQLVPVDRWIRTSVKERPVLAVMGALGVGYLVGRLLRL